MTERFDAYCRRKEAAALSANIPGYTTAEQKAAAALVPIGFLITSLAMPAWVMLGYWFVIQFLSGLVSIGGQGGGVAFWAHVGGFVAGLALIKIFARSDYITAHRAHHWQSGLQVAKRSRDYQRM